MIRVRSGIICLNVLQEEQAVQQERENYFS
jgi:hypothetical protein